MQSIINGFRIRQISLTKVRTCSWRSPRRPRSSCSRGRSGGCWCRHSPAPATPAQRRHHHQAPPGESGVVNYTSAFLLFSALTLPEGWALLPIAQQMISIRQANKNGLVIVNECYVYFVTTSVSVNTMRHRQWTMKLWKGESIFLSCLNIIVVNSVARYKTYM